PYHSQLYTLDYLGLSDKKIASSDINVRTTIGHEHHATPSYLREQNIHLFDITRGIVYARGEKPTAALIEAERLTNEINVDTEEPVLTAHCRRNNDLFLVFASPLRQDDFDAVFGHLTKCRFYTLEHKATISPAEEKETNQ
ncbi:MAG: hypothetical protein HN348_29695, partial [Proteobacteria bacterium]|nr:hypothetical protein [Pseudomonadota bacterium]